MTTMMIEIRLSEWAQYIAQDVNGDWWQYSHKPEAGPGHWISLDGKDEFLAKGPMPADWTKEIHEVER